MVPSGLGEMRAALDEVDYLVDDGLSMALYLATKLGQPLLLEGEPGVGKTTAAKALAESLRTPLIRLQCYEGITASEALYEWNYPRQMLAIRLAEAADGDITSADLFTPEFLLDRPLLKAIRHTADVPAVLLIDEIDRSDDEFEALLLEFLGESSITVPELGTFTAPRPPIVILTSNRSRELHDALKRRCYYHWIDYPAVDRAAAIVRRRVPGASMPLVDAATAFVSSVAPASTSTSLPGWPRRSTGSTRCTRSASPSWNARWPWRPSGRSPRRPTTTPRSVTRSTTDCPTRAWPRPCCR